VKGAVKINVNIHSGTRCDPALKKKKQKRHWIMVPMRLWIYRPVGILVQYGKKSSLYVRQ